MAAPVSNGPSGGRQPDGRFAPGNRAGKGNPNVRHVGALQRAVREAITPTELQEVLRKLRDLAIDGDVAAARLLIERVVGKPIDEPRTFGVALPDLGTSAGIADAMRQVAAAAALGDLSANDAASVVGVLRAVADATVVADLDERVQQLEDQKR